MSAHEPDSDVSRLNRFGHGRPIEVSDWTARVIERSLLWSKKSEGAFDVVRAGKRAVETRYLPRHVDQPMPQASHWTWLEIQGNSVRLLRPGCIDLGGIAKGFAVDRAVEAMIAAGATEGLVNAGGDLRAFGSNPWPVEVVDPLTRRAVASIDIRNAALATSAGLRSGAGLTVDHLDAGTQWVSVTVMAASCCDADALAKIVWADSAIAEGLLHHADARAFAVAADGSVVEIAEKAFA